MTQKSIIGKLGNVQTELKAPKGKYNSFGKYKYRSCEDILESVKPLLKKHGLILTLSDEITQIGDRFYVKATASVSDGEEPYSVSAYAREDADKKGMDGAQITGTASSYARKYALNGLFCIDDTKDADTDEYHNQVANAPQPQPSTPLTPVLNMIAGAKTMDDLNALKETYAGLAADSQYGEQFKKAFNAKYIELKNPPVAQFLANAKAQSITK